MPTTYLTSKPWVLALNPEAGVYQDTAKTTPAVADNDPVKAIVSADSNAFTWTESTTPPVLKTGGINGHPSIYFDGTKKALKLAHASAGALNTAQNGSYSLVFTIKNSGNLSYSFFFSKWGGGDARMMFGMVENLLLRYDQKYIGSPSDGGYADFDVDSTAILVYTFQLTGTDTGVEKFYLNGFLMASRTGSMPSVDTSSVWAIGNTSTDGFPFKGHLGRCYMLGSVLSPAEVTGVTQELAALYGTPTLRSPNPYNIALTTAGDSNTLGAGGATNGGYLKVACDNLGIYDATNWAIGGSSIQTMIDMVPHRQTYALRAGLADGRTSIISIMDGTNNILVDNQTGAQAYSALCNLVNTVRANVPAAKIVVHTIPAFEDATLQSRRNDYNTLIRGGIAAGTLAADTVLDSGGNAAIDTFSNTYYLGVHLNNAGHVIFAQPLEAYLASFDALAPAVPTGLAGSGAMNRNILTWNANTDDAVRYDLDLNGTTQNVGNVTSYTHTGLTNGTPYTYRVRAIDANNNISAWSSPVSSTPQPLSESEKDDLYEEFKLRLIQEKLVRRVVRG